MLFPAGFRRHAEFKGLSTERVSSDPGGPTRFSSHRIHCGLHGSGSSGEAYSALRGWRPIPAALLAPSQHRSSGAGDLPLLPQGNNSPDKTLSIGKKRLGVKIKKTLAKAQDSRNQLLIRYPCRNYGAASPSRTVPSRTICRCKSWRINGLGRSLLQFQDLFFLRG